MHSSPIIASALALSCALALAVSTRAPAIAASAPLLTSGPIPIDSLPFTCNQPGIYHLTANLTGQPNTVGISVTSDGVTIDLCGHELSGADAGSIAIYCPGATDLEVRNGRITDWTQSGIQTAAQLSVSDVWISGTTENGLFCGRTSFIERVRVVGSMDQGLVAGFGAIVRDTAVSLSSARGTALLLADFACAERCFITGAEIGIEARNNSAVRSSDVRTASKIAILAHDRVVLDEVDVFAIAAAGIEVQNECTVYRCEVFGSPLDGLRVVGRNNRIEANNLRENTTGLRVEGGHNLVVRNMAFENGQDFVIAPLNSVGPILRDFMTISSSNPHANHGTPYL